MQTSSLFRLVINAILYFVFMIIAIIIAYNCIHPTKDNKDDEEDNEK